MKLFIIVHIIGAVLAFIFLYVWTELRTPDFVKKLANATNQNYAHYGRMILFAVIWELCLIFMILVFLGELVQLTIKSIIKRRKK